MEIDEYKPWKVIQKKIWYDGKAKGKVISLPQYVICTWEIINSPLFGNLSELKVLKIAFFVVWYLYLIISTSRRSSAIA